MNNPKNIQEQVETLIIFSHGKESGPWGQKIKALSEIGQNFGAQVLSIDYTDLPDVSSRINRLLQTTLPSHKHLILVGSSMGAYVSIIASRQLQPSGIFLMAPAVGITDYPELMPRSYECLTEVVMGWQDEVINVTSVFEWALLHNTNLHLVPADHRLSECNHQLNYYFTDFLQKILGPK
jgi:alpha/beta superfamily hydrolase